MFRSLKVWATSKGWFWQLRSQFARITFQFDKFIHYRKSDLQTQIRHTNIGRRLLWTGFKKFLAVAIFIFVLEWLEVTILNKFSLEVWFDQQTVSDYNGQLEFYAVLLAAIFSIYFATIGIILSTGYARLNRDIISLLIGEQVGSFYTGMLVSATAFCLAVTALNVFEYQTGLLVYFAATVLTVISVLVLFPMGQRLFSFFELSPLVEIEILPKIAQSINSVSKPGTSVSLQNYFSKKAKSHIAQFFYIDDTLQADRKKLNQNLPELTKHLSSLLIHYLSRKHLIHNDSYWYPRRHVYKDWFLAGDSTTSMAISTGSQITPEETPDPDWLENEVLPRIHNHLEKALKIKDWDLALTLLWQMSHRTFQCAQGFYFSTGLQDIDATRQLLEEYLVGSANSDEEQKQVMALIDTWVAGAHNFFLETMRRIQTFDEELVDFFEQDNWSPDASRKLPAFLQLNIKYLQDWVAFENNVEGRRLSGKKYLQQLTIKAVLEHYSSIVETIGSYESKEFISFANKLLELDHPASATHVILTSLHANWKLPNWFVELENLLERYSKYEKYKDEFYKFPRINIDSIQSELEAARENLISKLTDKKLGKHLFNFEGRSTSIPDYFGQTYFILADECVAALEQNLPEKLSSIFQTFLTLALLADSVKFADPELEVNPNTRLHLMSAVNKDMASILGFAILYSEYHGNEELQNVAVSLWENMTDGANDKGKYLERMLLISNSNRYSMTLPIRYSFLSQWQINFEAKLRDDGFGDDYGAYKNKQHTSDIIEEFRGRYYDASDVFFALKVLDQLDINDDEIDHRIKTYKTQLARRQGDQE